MATLYVSEHTAVGGRLAGAYAQALIEPPLAEQTVAIGGTSAQSAAFQARTSLVRLHSDVTCHVAFGADPTATTSLKRMVAGQTEAFAIPKGEGFKVAVIQGS